MVTTETCKHNVFFVGRCNTELQRGGNIWFSERVLRDISLYSGVDKGARAIAITKRVNDHDITRYRLCKHGGCSLTMDI